MTDDSELALCQMQGLIDGNGKLNTAHIAKYYGQWYNDGPFDIGSATQGGLKGINMDNPTAEQARASANIHNR